MPLTVYVYVYSVCPCVTSTRKPLKHADHIGGVYTILSGLCVECFTIKGKL